MKELPSEQKTHQVGKREVIKQRDGSILVIDFDQFNQLISQKQYPSTEEYQQDDTFDSPHSPTESPTQASDLTLIRERQRLIQQERSRQQRLSDSAFKSLVLKTPPNQLPAPLQLADKSKALRETLQMEEIEEF